MCTTQWRVNQSVYSLQNTARASSRSPLAPALRSPPCTWRGDSFNELSGMTPTANGHETPWWWCQCCTRQVQSSLYALNSQFSFNTDTVMLRKSFDLLGKWKPDCASLYVLLLSACSSLPCCSPIDSPHQREAAKRLSHFREDVTWPSKWMRTRVISRLHTDKYLENKETQRKWITATHLILVAELTFFRAYTLSFTTVIPSFSASSGSYTPQVPTGPSHQRYASPTRVKNCGADTAVSKTFTKHRLATVGQNATDSDSTEM